MSCSSWNKCFYFLGYQIIQFIEHNIYIAPAEIFNFLFFNSAIRKIVVFFMETQTLSENVRSQIRLEFNQETIPQWLGCRLLLKVMSRVPLAAVLKSTNCIITFPNSKPRTVWVELSREEQSHQSQPIRLKSPQIIKESNSIAEEI